MTAVDCRVIDCWCQKRRDPVRDSWYRIYVLYRVGARWDIAGWCWGVCSSTKRVWV